MSSRKRNASSMSETDSRVSAATERSAQKQQPAKKKSRKRYWLGKIPSWLAKEWFDNDEQYPEGSVLGHLSLLPSDDISKLGSTSMTDGSTDGYKRSLTVVPPAGPAAKPLSIPRKLLMDFSKEIPSRESMKHGELVRGAKDQSLVFMDRPSFPEGSHVRVLDDLTGEVLKARVTGVTKDRRFNVAMNGTLRERYGVSDFHMEHDCSVHSSAEIAKMSRCVKKGLVTSLCNVTADKRDPYFNRWMLQQSRKRMSKKPSAIISAQRREAAFRETRAEQRRQFESAYAGRRSGNSRGRGSGDASGASSSSSSAGLSSSSSSRGRRVRKSKEEYQRVLFGVFQKHASVSQRELEKLTHEPWQFLKDVMPEFCVSTGRRGNEGKVWALKPEYRLFSDSSSSSL